uniref:VWFA domain-containing protein n=2 Tax=Panagrellus redivivus TaxID=6233 RepID=A0A7E4VK57_PANRE
MFQTKTEGLWESIRSSLTLILSTDGVADEVYRKLEDDIFLYSVMVSGAEVPIDQGAITDEDEEFGCGFFKRLDHFLTAHLNAIIAPAGEVFEARQDLSPVFSATSCLNGGGPKYDEALLRALAEFERTAHQIFQSCIENTLRSGTVSGREYVNWHTFLSSQECLRFLYCTFDSKVMEYLKIQLTGIAALSCYELLEEYVKIWTNYCHGAETLSEMFSCIDRHWVHRKINEDEGQIFKLYELCIHNFEQAIFEKVNVDLTTAILQLVCMKEMKRFWYTVLTLVAIAVAFCDAVALHFTASNTTSSVNGKTLMIMIEATTQNGAAVNSLVTNAHFLNEIDQEWFKTFIVIAFDATGVLRSVVTTNYYEVYGALSLIAHSLTGNSTCEEAFLGAAIDSIWRNNAAPDSIVYIITSAGSFNADQTEYLGINRNTQPSIHLQYILVKNPACPYTINNTYDPTFMTAWIAVNFESGNVFKIDAENVGSFVQAHLPTLYRTKLAANPTNAFTCLDTVFDFNVEPDVRTIYLYSLSANATPIISRGYASYSLNTVFDDGYARILSLIPDSPGKYTVALTAYGDCNLQIRKYTVALTAHGDCNLQIRFEGDFEANTIPTTPIPNQYQNVQADITLILDVGGDVPIDKRADLRNFFMNALAQFDVGWEHNLHVSIIIAYGDDGIQVYYIYGFKDILDLSTLNKALAHVYNDTNSKKGGQTVLSE